jgi:hypothetical protein
MRVRRIPPAGAILFLTALLVAVDVGILVVRRVGRIAFALELGRWL